MRRFALFAVRVVCTYLVLLLPWPGWKAAYNTWFCGLGAVAALGGAWIVRVEAIPATENSRLSTRFTVANPARMDPLGKTPAKLLDLDAWGVGWVPTALALALIGATSLPISRRMLALAWGAVLINLYIILCIRVFLWDGSADLMGANQLLDSLAGALSYTLVTQMGAGFAAAVIVWLLAIGGIPSPSLGNSRRGQSRMALS